MADNDDHDAVELASAYLDGETTADERARVESDATLMAEVERLRRVRDAVAAVPSAPASTRESAIAAAMAAIDEVPTEHAQPEPPAAPSNVTSLERRRQMRLMQSLTAAAAVGVLVIGGFVIANRGAGDDDSTADEAPAAASQVIRDATEDIAVSSVPMPAAAPTTTAAVPSASGDGAAETESADEPMAAAPDETTAESAIDAAAAPAADAPPVLHDADDLRRFAEGLADDPPGFADVVAECEQGRRLPVAVFEDSDGATIEVVVAITADGYAAVSLDDSAIVLRSST